MSVLAETVTRCELWGKLLYLLDLTLLISELTLLLLTICEGLSSINVKLMISMAMQSSYFHYFY